MEENQEQVQAPVEAQVEAPKEQVQAPVEALPTLIGIMGIVQNLSNLLPQAHALISEYNKKFALLKEEKDRLFKISDGLDAKKHDIEAREAEVKRIENLDDLHKRAHELYESSSKRVNQAQQAENDLNAHTNSVKADIANKRELLLKEATALESHKKEFDAEVGRRVNETLIRMGIAQPVKKEEESNAAAS